MWQRRPILHWLLLFVLSYLAVTQATLFLVQGKKKLQRPMWDFFGDINQPSYEIMGPVVKVRVKSHCEVILPEETWDSEKYGEWSSTILFVHFRDTKYLQCLTFTQIIKQLDKYRQRMRALNYPEPQLAIFSTRTPDRSPFGFPEADPVDDYFLHRPAGLKLALVGYNTGRKLNTMVSRKDNVLFGLARQDHGPWNRMLKSSLWNILKIATYVTHGIAVLYALRQLFLLCYHQSFRITSRSIVFLLALYYLTVNGIFHYGDLQTNTYLMFIYSSWVLGTIAFNMVIVIWVRALQKIEPSKGVYILYVVSFLNVVNWCVICAMLIRATWTQDRRAWHDGNRMRSYIQPLLSILEAIFMLYFGTNLALNSKKSGGFSPEFQTIKRMTYLCLLSFVGYTFQALSALVMSQYQNFTVTNYVVTFLFYRISSITLYGAIFWVLRVHESLLHKSGAPRSQGLESHSRAPSTSLTHPTSFGPLPPWGPSNYIPKTAYAPTGQTLKPAAHLPHFSTLATSPPLPPPHSRDSRHLAFPGSPVAPSTVSRCSNSSFAISIASVPLAVGSAHLANPSTMPSAPSPQLSPRPSSLPQCPMRGSNNPRAQTNSVTPASR